MLRTIMGLLVCFGLSIAAASEGGDQFAKLLDRHVTLMADDITVNDAYGEILEKAPKQGLPLINGSRGSVVGNEVLERHISLHLTDVSVRDAFSALVVATDDAIEIDWSEQQTSPWMEPSERVKKEQQASGKRGH